MAAASAAPLDIPTIVWRAFSRRARMARHRQVETFATSDAVTVRARDGAPIPVQVDGDFIGEQDAVRFAVRRRALTVVA